MKLLLFDGFSLICRAFYALPLLTNKNGEYTNAVYGFLSIFLRFIDEEKPDYVAVAFDLPKPTFRHGIYGAYKGTRRALPDELRVQVPTIKNLLSFMEVSVSEMEGFEADDVLGTLARLAEDRGINPVIVSGDRDLLQLASDSTKILIPKTKSGKTVVEAYDRAEVLEKYGVTPERYVDVKALMGDASDNIPGVPGIGEVTATKIISSFGSLLNALERAQEVKPKKAAENLLTYREQALLSYELAKINKEAPIELILTPPVNMRIQRAYDEIKRLELKTLYKRFELTIDNKSVSETEIDSHSRETIQQDEKNNRMGEASEHHLLQQSTPAQWIDSKNDAKKFVRGLTNAAITFLWNEKQELTLDGESSRYPVGVGIHSESGESAYFSAGDSMSPSELMEILTPWLLSKSTKWVFDKKTLLGKLDALGIELGGIVHDAGLLSYVQDVTAPPKNISELAKKHLNTETKSLEELLENKGKRTKDRRDVSDLDVEIKKTYATQGSWAILDSFKKIENELEEAQKELYKKIELPLTYVLHKMEKLGIKVDRDFLLTYGTTLDGRIVELESGIHGLAGGTFNINSPAQLGEVLFEKLRLKGGKKTTKGYSTAADVLEKLAGKHEIIPLLLEYRTNTKLKSTYIDALLPLINPESGRIHTTFHQTLTSTGRLSSSDPNLQNIPVRTKLGRELRKAFVADEGKVFVDADYNQIELRLLAHMSRDPVLIRAYNENMDIHRLTASQVLGKHPDDVTEEERSGAKAVNFGIVYGMSSFGLAGDLGISVGDAKEYMDSYFDKYAGVKKFQKKCIEAAKKDGYAVTMFGRRRYIHELRAQNRNTRQFGERIAMNTPLQGSAADIIKIAMVNVDRRLRKDGLSAKMVMQVHDELLVETPLAEVEHVKALLKEEMEQTVKLEVPLTVNLSVGSNWHDAK